VIQKQGYQMGITINVRVVPTATPDIQESKVVLGTVYGHHQYIAMS